MGAAVVPTHALRAAARYPPCLGLLHLALWAFVRPPLIGHWSDSCRCPYGRRRPFIVAGAALVAVAAMLIAFSRDLGYALGDARIEAGRPLVGAIVVFILGFWLLDLANNSLQGPCRALLADFTGTEGKRTRRANAYFSAFMALGNVLGFAAGSYPHLASALSSPLSLLLRPFGGFSLVTAACNGVVSGFSASEIEEMGAGEMGHKMGTNGTRAADAETSRKEETEEKAENGEQEEEEEEEEGEEEPKQVLLWELVSSVQQLPPPVLRVLAVTALTWLAWFPFLLFDTDWMGREANATGSLCCSLPQNGLVTAGLRKLIGARKLGMLEPMLESQPAVARQHSLLLPFSSISGVSQSRVAKAAALTIFAVLGAPMAVSWVMHGIRVITVVGTGAFTAANVRLSLLKHARQRHSVLTSFAVLGAPMAVSGPTVLLL
ncbi:unnamed protein product [Closterium sp. Naga37s-1]|nr:unnamed protein product [Closterium sp. Naga37s-1]